MTGTSYAASANAFTGVHRLTSPATPFSTADLEGISGDVVHVNPLWYPEFPPELLAVLRDRARTLAIDAQGFLRRAGDDGTLALVDWDEKTRWLVKLGISAASRHQTGVSTHAKRAQEAGATEEEIIHALLLVIPTCGFPTFMEAYNQFKGA